MEFFDYGTQQFAFLTGHHLVVDLVTWRLLLEELEEILKGGQLLAPALPFQKWAELQQEHAESLELSDVLPDVDVPPMDFTYWGIQHQDNTYGNASHASFELDNELSSAFLTTCHNAYKTEPVEVLLASLIQSWSQVFTDRPIPAIFNEGHGREPWDSSIDITRTVGWFTALSPILVTPSEKATDTVRKTKDFKRRIPGNGRPYFARRCLTPDGRETYKSHWPMEILFNYLGQYQVCGFVENSNHERFTHVLASNLRGLMPFFNHWVPWQVRLARLAVLLTLDIVLADGAFLRFLPLCSKADSKSLLLSIVTCSIRQTS